jgi:large subunit ribosomal protein L10
MTKQEKNEVIELLKGKFSQYNNFYITDTESLTVEQVSNLRRTCFNKQVEMKVAKNTLIRKALEGLDAEKYAGVYDSLHKVTALMFSENPKDPAVILSSFRKDNNKEKPVLKAAFINGDVFVGDNQLKVLTQIKTKNELIGEVIGLLLSPIQRVLGALENKDNAKKPSDEPVAAAPVAEPSAAVTETSAPEVPATETPAPEAPADSTPESPAPEAPADSTPESPAAEATPEA